MGGYAYGYAYLETDIYKPKSGETYWIKHRCKKCGRIWAQVNYDESQKCPRCRSNKTEVEA